MAGDRQALQDLPRVASTACVLRLVHWQHWNADAPPGERLPPSNLKTDDCTPRSASYGASFWLHRDEVSPDGVDIGDLEAANPKYQAHGVLRIRVGAAEAHGVYFAHSPHDSCYPTIADAHVTLVWPNGFDATLRRKLLQLFEADVVREPIPPDP